MKDDEERGFCQICGIVDQQLLCEHPRLRIPPTLLNEPEWMDDPILVCGKHSIVFTKETDECFVCTNRGTVPKLTEEDQTFMKSLECYGTRNMDINRLRNIIYRLVGETQ